MSLLKFEKDVDDDNRYSVHQINIISSRNIAMKQASRFTTSSTCLIIISV